MLSGSRPGAPPRILERRQLCGLRVIGRVFLGSGVQLMQLLVPAESLETLTRELLASSPEEGAAFLSVHESGSNWVLRAQRIFQRSELAAGEFGELTLTESAQLDGLADIKRSGCGLVEVHTHPFSRGDVRFSEFDELQLPIFARYFCNKLPGRTFGSLVIGTAGYAGRAWNGDSFDDLELRPIGERVKIPPWARSVQAPNTSAATIYDRQIRALGAEGQRGLSTLKVAVVGLGGTGSQVAQQLAHLGVAELVLLDDDTVEWSNLPRLSGATWWGHASSQKEDCCRSAASPSLAARSSTADGRQSASFGCAEVPREC